MRAGQNSAVASVVYRMDCSFPARDFLMQLLVRQGDPNNCSSKSWVLRSWVLWTCILVLWGVYNLNKNYYQDKHIVLW